MPALQTTLLWGPTATGKTHLLATAARGYHNHTGRKVRLVSAESAQSQSQMGKLIAEGIVEAWYLDGKADFPFERLWQAMLGYWPIDPQEPLSLMVPAFSYRYEAACAKCQTKPYDSDKPPDLKAIELLKCPKCKEALLVRTVRVVDKRNGIDKVGMYQFEGLTEFSAMMMKDMSVRTAKYMLTGSAQESLGGNSAVAFRDGELIVGGTTLPHFGTAQSQIKYRVDESKHLHGVDFVLWTAVDSDDRDKDNKRAGRCFGPKVAGSAATSDIPRWFGPTLGTCLVPQHGTMKGKEYRLYMETFYQTWDALDAKVPNLCNNRIPPNQLRRGKPDQVPEYYVVDPENETLLWDVLKLICERQGVPVPARTPVAQLAEVKRA
jgi:hypothetical protein